MRITDPVRAELPAGAVSRRCGALLDLIDAEFAKLNCEIEQKDHALGLGRSHILSLVGRQHPRSLAQAPHTAEVMLAALQGAPQPKPWDDSKAPSIDALTAAEELRALVINALRVERAAFSSVNWGQAHRCINNWMARERLDTILK